LRARGCFSPLPAGEKKPGDAPRQTKVQQKTEHRLRRTTENADFNDGAFSMVSLSNGFPVSIPDFLILSTLNNPTPRAAAFTRPTIC